MGKPHKNADDKHLLYTVLHTHTHSNLYTTDTTTKKPRQEKKIQLFFITDA